MENDKTDESSDSIIENQAKPMKKSFHLENQLERVATFSTPLDIILVDEKTGALIEQPICNMTFDETTRHIISMFISQS